MDANQCADLAIGSPGLDGQGGVYLLRGSRAGITSAGGVKISAPDGVAGDDFGAAVAAAVRPDGGTDLWVGAPGRSVSGQATAGEVYHFTISRTFVPALVGTLSYATAGVAGDPEAGDRFGSVLSASDGQLAVGVPRRTVAGELGAGEVVFVAAQPTGTSKAQVLSQESAGVPGAAEAGDHFGAAVDGGAVGVPGEDVGSVTDAGMVQTFSYDSARGGYVVGPSYTEDTTGVPGKAEDGDLFGAALARGTWYLCQGEGDLAVGSPGESLGTLRGAGAVTVLGVQSDGTPCPARFYSQGSGLAGIPAAGNHVGATLAALSGNADDDADYRSGLVIGAPGEDGSAANAGRVLPALGVQAPLREAIGGDVADLAFGSVLPSS